MALKGVCARFFPFFSLHNLGVFLPPFGALGVLPFVLCFGFRLSHSLFLKHLFFVQKTCRRTQQHARRLQWKCPSRHRLKQQQRSLCSPWQPSARWLQNRRASRHHLHQARVLPSRALKLQNVLQVVNTRQHHKRNLLGRRNDGRSTRKCVMRAWRRLPRECFFIFTNVSQLLFQT